MTAFLLRRPDESMVRHAAWVARCVGRSDVAPLREADLAALASYIRERDAERGAVLFREGEPPVGVVIIRSGLVELAVGSGRRRAVVTLLHPGDVDGDVELFMRMPFPYTARALEETRCLVIAPDSFERLFSEHPAIARRWFSSIVSRLVRSQARVLELLGRSLPEQIARLLVAEENEGEVRLPQRTVAAMLGVHRPSLNKALKELEREGFLSLGYGHIRIEDRERLQRLARLG